MFIRLSNVCQKVKEVAQSYLSLRKGIVLWGQGVRWMPAFRQVYLRVTVASTCLPVGSN